MLAWQKGQAVMLYSPTSTHHTGGNHDFVAYAAVARSSDCGISYVGGMNLNLLWGELLTVTVVKHGGQTRSVTAFLQEGWYHRHSHHG
mmetsp:Transcript_34717/g.73910  ORF Transcript_34717/g.73910 Transcript_34717/m.73910 type:complete len:88 (-) Transcript_34717:55-318(-)